VTRPAGSIITPVEFSDTSDYRAIVRAVQLLPQFDRILIGLLYKIPFGTVSRVLSTFRGEGIILATGSFTEYSAPLIYANWDLVDVRINYSQNADQEIFTSDTLVKGPQFEIFLEEWTKFLSRQLSLKL